MEILRINFRPVSFDCRFMYRQVPEFRIIVGPTPFNSYQGDPDYVSTCNHEHDLRCDRCELFPNVVSEIESSLENVVISSDEKEEMKYDVSLAKKRIEAWKAHLLSTKTRRGWMS